MSILIAVILAFLGGVAATCIGALGSVILCAFVALAGVCAVMAGCEYNIATQIAFGFFLSPHLGLGPAACALGYAAKKGLVEDSKGIALPLMMLGRPDVLIMGGIFAVASYFIKIGLDQVFGPGGIDSVSLTIVIVGIIAKILFGNQGLIGKVPEGDKRFGISSQNIWMPHMPAAEGITYALFAAGASAVAGWLFWEMSEYGKHVMETNEVVGQNIMINAQFPVFALAVIFLILLVCGLPCPVFHHVGLSSCYGAMGAYAAGAGELTVLIWAISCGILSHFVADWLANIFLVYGDGYVDPPSLSMAFMSVFTFIIFPAIGFYSAGLVNIIPWILLVVAVVIAVVLQVKRNAAKAAAPAEPAA